MTSYLAEVQLHDEPALGVVAADQSRLSVNKVSLPRTTHAFTCSSLASHMR